jgi:hypothetical protein
MGLALTVTVELTEINCGACGGTYAINERYRQQKYEKGATWNCPYCRVSWGYIKGENERLKEEIAAERARTQAALSRENAARAEKVRVVRERDRLKKRVKAGVCPCCHRTFKQLVAHMKHKHPDYAK